MGCNRDVTETDLQQICGTAGGLDDPAHPEAVDINVLDMAVSFYGEPAVRNMLKDEGWTESQIDRLFAELHPPSASIDERMLVEAISNYEEGTIQELSLLFDQVPSYVNDMLSILNEAAEAEIQGMEKVFYNMYEGGYKAISAHQTVGYVLTHKDEIAEVEAYAPRARNDGTFYGVPGADIVNKDGSIVELKHYDFTRDYYSFHAEEVCTNVIEQAKSRLEPGVPSVTIVFSKDSGEMPSSLRDALEKATQAEIRIKVTME